MSSKPQTLQVLVADAQPMIGWGLRHYLAEHCHAQVAEWVQDTDALLQQLEQRPELDVLILEMALPGSRGRDGVHMIEWLQRNYPNLKVLVYSIMGAPLMARATLKCGASAYVCKRSPLGALEEALARIRDGHTYIDANLRPQRHTGRPLSPTEIDILRRLSHGATVGEIAERTNRSVSTISTHKRNAMQKLGVTNDAQLVIAGMLDWLGEF
ncbi:response regulator transcription factor [Pseudomonas citronellolis]|uniref:response regulator transcription factor n=1 Tax=Pseudomonas citronellolis TaxID=53408 RepID=UPI0023E3A9C6|nr:response regulator transcription factor [Pseudomonas citronellolis]MDF3932056.1 response regulator transcription factor [Pseudomonas citronellolis]